MSDQSSLCFALKLRFTLFILISIDVVTVRRGSDILVFNDVNSNCLMLFFFSFISSYDILSASCVIKFC